MKNQKNTVSVGISKLVATAFGAGYAPKAPGTAGALAATVFLYLFNTALVRYGATHMEVTILDLLLLTVTFFAGVIAIKQVHEVWQHDAGKIVIDEVAGIFVTLLLSPPDWRYYLAGFILFRFFDIAKPLYIKRVDKLKTSWSVMLDDIIAGVYSFAVLQAASLLL